MATKKTVKTEAPAEAKKAVPAAKKGVDIEAIRKKAEEIYHARVARGEHGTAESDWHHAEKLLKTGGTTVVKKPAAKKK